MAQNNQKRVLKETEDSEQLLQKSNHKLKSKKAKD
jgi:hypothetical protein